jgi:hypothetical protein
VTALPVPLAGDVAALDPAYEDHLLRALVQIRVVLMVATPAWAAEVLGGCNTRNRKLSNAWNRLRSAIVRGAWRVNGECVVFDTDGVLIDGQHRLHAIAQSGRTVPVLVVYGVEPDAFVTFDQGKKRSGADVLSTDADFREHAGTTAAALAWLARKEQGQLHSTSSLVAVPNDEILERVRQYPGLIESVQRAHGELRSRLIPPGMTAFLDYMLNDIDPEAGEQFLSRVCTGIDVPRDSWEARLRKRLEDFAGKRTSLAQRDLLALVIKAFHGSYRGLRVPNVLVWRSGGECPEPFPAFPQA